MKNKSYHEKFKEIIRKDTKSSKQTICVVPEPIDVSPIDETASLFLFEKEHIIEKIINKIEIFLIGIKAKIDFRISFKEKKEFQKVLDKVLNCRIDVPEIRTVDSNKKEIIIDEPLKEDIIIEAKEIKSSKPKTLDELSCETLSILNCNRELLDNYYSEEIFSYIAAINLEYKMASIDQTRKMIELVEKYQNKYIEQLNEIDNKKVQYELSKLHGKLTEQLLNLIQNDDFGYQKVK